MRGFIKVGAGIALLVLLAPFVVVLSGNPALVLPTWLIIVYAASQRLLPAPRRWLSAPAAIIGGQIAFRTLQVIVLGAVTPVAFALVALAALLTWLLATGARWAMAAVVTAEVAYLALEVAALPRTFEQIAARPLDLMPFVIAGFVAPVVAIGFLVPKLRPQPRPAPLAEVFD